MMYVEFMKNFASPIGSELMAVRFILPPEPKNFEAYFLDMMFVEFKKCFLLADSSALISVRLISVLSPKPFDSFFLDMMYVEFMKNFSSRRFERVIGC